MTTTAGRQVTALRPGRLTGRWRIVDPLVVLVCIVLVGMVVLEPRVGPNAALVDPFLGITLLIGLYVMARRQAPPALAAWRRLLPWLLLICLGTTLSLYSSGITGWAAINVAQSSYSVAAFFGVYAVIWKLRHALPVFGLALAAGIVITTIALALTLEPGVRPSGTFYHPNYAGHYLVLSAAVSWRALPWMWVRVVTTVVAAIGVFLTASFGALLMCAVLAAVGIWRQLNRRPWLATYGAAAVILALWLAGPQLVNMMSSDFAASDTLTSERLERSGGGRLAVWQESVSTIPADPLGVGPDGLHNRQLIMGAREPHNLYIAYLAERGVIGFVGLIGLGVALWRYASPRGVARPLFLAIVAGNIVRETFHYRHMWLILAIALVIDLVAENEGKRASSVSSTAPSPGGADRPAARPTP